MSPSGPLRAFANTGSNRSGTSTMRSPRACARPTARSSVSACGLRCTGTTSRFPESAPGSSSCMRVCLRQTSAQGPAQSRGGSRYAGGCGPGTRAFVQARSGSRALTGGESSRPRARSRTPPAEGSSSAPRARRGRRFASSAFPGRSPSSLASSSRIRSPTTIFLTVPPGIPLSTGRLPRSGSALDFAQSSTAGPAMRPGPGLDSRSRSTGCQCGGKCEPCQCGIDQGRGRDHRGSGAGRKP